MDFILNHGSDIIWILAGIAALFLFDIPQSIYYKLRPDKKPVPHVEVELVDYTETDPDEKKKGE